MVKALSQPIFFKGIQINMPTEKLEKFDATARVDQFFIAILQAEVQRKGLGISIGGLMSARKLAEQAINVLDAPN